MQGCIDEMKLVMPVKCSITVLYAPVFQDTQEAYTNRAPVPVPTKGCTVDNVADHDEYYDVTAGPQYGYKARLSCGTLSESSLS